MQERLEKSVQIGMLNAYYGGLLTEKQREALRLHYEEDLSLGEIAEQFGVSRQNVHELITRSAQKLERYEAQLGGVKRTQTLVRTLQRVDELLMSAQASADEPTSKLLKEASELIATAIRAQQEEENEHGI